MGMGGVIVTPAAWEGERAFHQEDSLIMLLVTKSCCCRQAMKVRGDWSVALPEPAPAILERVPPAGPHRVRFILKPPLAENKAPKTNSFHVAALSLGMC